MRRPPIDQALARIQLFIPETIQTVSRFIADPALLRFIPRSSSTGSQIKVWPELLTGANDIPVGTLLQLGGVEAAIWGSNLSLPLRANEDGISEALLERPMGAIHNDDFQITIGRSTGYEWGEERPTFTVSVQHLASATLAESRVAGVFVSGLDDARLARLVDVALDGRRYRLPCREALLAVRDHAIAFSARRSGFSWRLPSGRQFEDKLSGELEATAPGL